MATKTATHPNYPGYVFNSDGSITFTNGKVSSGRGEPGDYKLIVLRDKNARTPQVRVHRVLLEAFAGELAGEREVDHINCVKDDNRPENLRFLTKLEHRRYTHACNPDSQRRFAKKHYLAVIGTHPDGRNIQFKSIKQALHFLGLNEKAGSITYAIQTKGTIKGWRFRYVPIEAVGEEWRLLENFPGLESQIWLSNFGRFKSKTRISYGYVADKYFRACVKINGVFKSKGVHTLVCWAFHGPRPEGCTSVNHKDRNTQNNRPENLEWSNAVAQAIHKRDTDAADTIGPLPITIEPDAARVVQRPNIMQTIHEEAPPILEYGDVYRAHPDHVPMPRPTPEPSLVRTQAKREKAGVTDEVIDKIRALLLQGNTSKQIAKDLEVSDDLICNIKMGRAKKLEEIGDNARVPLSTATRIIEVLKYIELHPMSEEDLVRNSLEIFKSYIPLDLARVLVKGRAVLVKKEFPLADTTWAEYLRIQTVLKNRHVAPPVRLGPIRVLNGP